MTEQDVAGWMTRDDGSRVAITRAEADALMAAIDESARRRAADMPTAKDALDRAMDAFLRLKDLGWNWGLYAPKDGTEFDACSVGSSGIHRVFYQAPRFWCCDGGDIWPYDVAMFRLDPADAERRALKMAAAAPRMRSETP